MCVKILIQLILQLYCDCFYLNFVDLVLSVFLFYLFIFTQILYCCMSSSHFMYVKPSTLHKYLKTVNANSQKH